MSGLFLNAIALLCATSAWLVSRRAPQHRPVAIALAVCALLDVVRSVVSLPPRVDMALCLGAPVWSRWAYVNAFGYRNGHEPIEAALTWLFILPAAIWFPASHWDMILPAAYGGLTILGGVAAILHRSPCILGWTVTQRTAAMLLAGDVAGLVLLCRREWISYQASAVLGLVALYQVWWLWRSRREG